MTSSFAFLRPSLHHVAAGAASALALAACATAQAQALQPADLTVSASASPTTVSANAEVAYTVTVNNIVTWRSVCTFDPDTHRKTCDVVENSADANGVVLRGTLAAGMQFVSATADHGFGCQGPAAGSAVVTCSGGSIAAGDSARLTLRVRMPAVSGALALRFDAALPAGVPERSTANNSATATVTVNNPQLPDLFAVGSSSPNPFRNGQDIAFQLRIYNYGPVAANGVTFNWNTNVPAVMTSSITVDSGFVCDPPQGGFTAQLTGVCRQGSIGPYNSALMTVRLKPTSNFLSYPFAFTMFGDVNPGSPRPIVELSYGNNLYTVPANVAP